MKPAHLWVFTGISKVTDDVEAFVSENTLNFLSPFLNPFNDFVELLGCLQVAGSRIQI